MLPAGTRVGPYEIISWLGAGGMGEVYRARDTKLLREVALKTLPEELARQPERLASNGGSGWPTAGPSIEGSPAGGGTAADRRRRRRRHEPHYRVGPALRGPAASHDRAHLGERLPIDVGDPGVCAG